VHFTHFLEHQINAHHSQGFFAVTENKRRIAISLSKLIKFILA
jgi:hypothetical protein